LKETFGLTPGYRLGVQVWPNLEAAINDDDDTVFRWAVDFEDEDYDSGDHLVPDFDCFKGGPVGRVAKYNDVGHIGLPGFAEVSAPLAHLFAASPDLFEALSEARHYVAEYEARNGSNKARTLLNAIDRALESALGLGSTPAIADEGKV
jgi:hypothetical protein